jgi:hypothetical protein
MISKKYSVLIILVIAVVAVIAAFQLIKSKNLLQNVSPTGTAQQANAVQTHSSSIPHIPVSGGNVPGGKGNNNGTEAGGGNAGGPPGGTQASGSSETGASKGPISLDSLKIVSVCSADVNSSLQVFDAQPCYVSAPPFYMVFLKNATQMLTGFYDNQGFSEMHDVNESNDDSTLVFKVFVQNMMAIGTTDVTPQISGGIAPYLRTGEITITDVYAEQPDIHQVQKNPVITTRILSIPVYIKNNIPLSTSWQKSSLDRKSVV